MAYIQPVPLRQSINLDGFATYYYSFAFNNRTTGSSNEKFLAQVMATAGTIQNVGVTISGAPGAATGFTFTLRKNLADTAITFSITGSNTSGSDTTHTVSYSAGDVLNWVVSQTNNPVGFSIKYSYYEIVYASKACQYYSLDAYGSVNNFGGFCFNLVGNSVANVPTVIPCDGVVTGVELSQLGTGTTGSFNFLLNKNGTDQDGTSGSTNTQCSLSLADGTNRTLASASFSLSVTAGDLLYVKAAAVSAPSTGKWIGYCYIFVPTGSGAPVMMNSGANTLTTAAVTDYEDCVSPLINAVVDNSTQLPTPLFSSKQFEISSLYIRLSGAPGAAKTRTFSLMKNGSAQSLSVVITGASQTTGNDTNAGHKFKVNNGDTIGFQQVVAAGTTGAARITYGFAMAEVGGGKGAGGGNSNSGKKAGGGGLSVQNPGGASFIQIGNAGLDVGVTS